MEYDKTLNLPKTDFPMRGNLPKKEPEYLEFWNEIDIYKLIQEKNKGQEKYILHDGPPYANGDIHLGTALNKMLKDIVVKYKSMMGFDAPYVPGWDTHGLPIANKVDKELKVDRHNVPIPELRKMYGEYALKYVDIQRESFRRLGVRGDFDNPYLTLLPEYEAAQIEVFAEMVHNKHIYKGLKPVYWCADCETALAEAEVEYEDKRSPSIYVKFNVRDGKGVLDGDVNLVIWTTTPWTLPANVAISVHPKYEYEVILVNENKFLVAKDMRNEFLNNVDLGDAEVSVLKELVGSDLEGIICVNPVMDSDSVVILGDHVTLEAGTGLVHTAPGHGIEDFEVGQKYDLPVVSPVDFQGKFTEEAGKYAGLDAVESNKVICQDLEASGHLLKLIFIKHSYPHCWRCHKPLMFRATKQWFASIKGLRELSLKAINEDVKWIPSWGRERIGNMVRDRSDWCISRQRVWGVPIPIFYCAHCEQPILDKEVILHVGEQIRKEGSNVWFAKEAKDLVPDGLTCPHCSGQEFTKESDIMDVWFDSGVSSHAVLKQREELSYPADLYLEGSDQYRGWFNSSLSCAVAVTGKAPYKAVLTHGYVVDGKGRKMSKSIGNGIDPKDIIKQMGADILRIWAASSDYRKDISASNEIFKQASETYRKIRNTLRFLHSNLYDYDQNAPKIPFNELSELDKYILFKKDEMLKEVVASFDEYEFYHVVQRVHHFCNVELSSFYLDVIKDRLYASSKDDVIRVGSQQVINEILIDLTKIISPILTFTSEEMWRYFEFADKEVSVQLSDFPTVSSNDYDQNLISKWDTLLNIRDSILKELELGRSDGKFGNSLGAKLTLKTGNKNVLDFLNGNEKILLDISIVSRLEIIFDDSNLVTNSEFNTEDIEVIVDGIEDKKCERCWMYVEGVGSDSEYDTLCPRCVEVVKGL